MTYQVFPLMNFTQSKVEEKEALMIVSAPFDALITKIHARLDEGACKLRLKVANVLLADSTMLVEGPTAVLSPPGGYAVASGDPIHLKVNDPVEAVNLYVQLTLKRL